MIAAQAMPGQTDARRSLDHLMAINACALKKV